ncbi:MAG: ABC transporter permease [Elusimicrobia bacterium]|nr:ABC transporter permease [Elusimicrobiota bacterium]
MNLSESARIARKSLSVNRMRSFLSMLGLVIGIAAVTVVTAIGSGIRRSVMEIFASMGTDVLQVMPNFEAGFARPAMLSLEGVERVAHLPFVEGAFPDTLYNAEARGEFTVSGITGIGIYPRYLEIYGIPIAAGRNIEDRDVRERRRVCLLGSEASRKLFGAADPLGRSLRFGRGVYEVVGVFGVSARLAMAGRPPAEVYLPTTALLREETELFETIGSAEVWVRKGYAGDPKDDILTALAGDPNKKKLFMIQDPKVLAAESQKNFRKLQVAMLALAGVALLVGGIGIMNMALISVAERTREIGLRKALGATPRDILLQFLVEVVALCAAGGVLGVLLGTGAALAIPHVTPEKLPVAIEPAAVLAALLFSVLVGCAFGLYPALKASRLSPLEALRYE